SPYQKVSMMLNLLFVIKNLILNKIWHLKNSQKLVKHTKQKFGKHVVFWISSLMKDISLVNQQYIVPVITDFGKINTLLDTGSTINLIHQEIVEKHQLKILFNQQQQVQTLYTKTTLYKTTFIRLFIPEKQQFMEVECFILED